MGLVSNRLRESEMVRRLKERAEKNGSGTKRDEERCFNVLALFTNRQTDHREGNGIKESEG